MIKELRVAGCFGQLKDSENENKITQFELPLTYIYHQVNIFNGIAEVQINQTYLNTTEKYLQIQYKLPIIPNACLHKFAAIFQKVRMEGTVKEKQIAKIEYQEAVKIGKKAAYGEVDSQNKDILTLKIGNIAPNEEVKIQISYAEQLSLNLNTFYQFNLFTKNTPLYVNRIPSEEYLNAFRNSVKCVGGNFEWDFKLRLKASRKIKSFKSLSHSLIIEKSNDLNTDLSFTLDKGEPFTKDFSFIYTTQDFELPSYTLGRTDAGSSVMVSFIPKFCSLDVKDAKLAAINAQSFETDMDGVRGEYIFLLDRSGSMGGQPIEKAKQALILFLKSLPIDTYFQVVSFGSGSQKMFQQSQKNSNQSINNATQLINPMKADLGGTSIFQPLQNIFKSKLIEGYPRQIFLLTDGDVSDSQNVINLIAKNTKYSRVHTIGIGSDVSKNLIIQSANKGKGKHIFIGNGQNPAVKIIQLLNDSLTPVISKVTLNYDKDIVESIVPNPQKLPYILKGDIVTFYLSFKGQLSSPTCISLAYTDSLNNLPFKGEIQVSPQSQNESYVDKLANYRRIKALEDAQLNGNVQDYLYYVKTADKKQQIIDLSVKHQILSKYTAFICVQKELIDGKYEQIQGKGKQKVQIVEYNQPKIDKIKPKVQYYQQKADSYQQPVVQKKKTFNKLFGIDSCQPPLASPMLPTAPPNFSIPPPPVYQSDQFKNFFGRPNIRSVGPPMPQLIMNKPPPITEQERKNRVDKFSSLFGLDGEGSSLKKFTAPIAPPPPGLTTQQLFIPPPPPPTINQILPPPPTIQFEQLQLSMNTAITPPPPSLSLGYSPPPPPPLTSLNIGISLPPPSLSPSIVNTQFSFPPMPVNSIIPPQQTALNLNSTSVPTKPQAKNVIQLIINSQQFQGKWSNLKLIEQLYGANLAKQIDLLQQKNVAITILIVKWFSKNCQSKEYSLILKKATNWLKKQNKYKQYSQIYDKET